MWWFFNAIHIFRCAIYISAIVLVSFDFPLISHIHNFWNIWQLLFALIMISFYNQMNEPCSSVTTENTFCSCQRNQIDSGWKTNEWMYQKPQQKMTHKKESIKFVMRLVNIIHWKATAWYIFTLFYGISSESLRFPKKTEIEAVFQLYRTSPQVDSFSCSEVFHSFGLCVYVTKCYLERKIAGNFANWKWMLTLWMR